jgi:hypothetical protein
MKRCLRLATVLVFLGMVFSYTVPTYATASCPAGQGGQLKSISSPEGAKVRSRASMSSALVSRLEKGTAFTLLNVVEGDPVSLMGQRSTQWAQMRTEKCIEGFVSALLISDFVAAPQGESSDQATGGVQAGGIFTELNILVTGARVLVLQPPNEEGKVYKKTEWTIRSSKGLTLLNSIYGRPGYWNGYRRAEDPTQPYDHFSYPYGGHFYGIVYLQMASGDEKEVWAWKQDNNDAELLVWVFRGKEFTCGGPCGNHNFIWFWAVDKATWDQNTKTR